MRRPPPGRRGAPVGLAGEFTHRHRARSASAGSMAARSLRPSAVTGTGTARAPASVGAHGVARVADRPGRARCRGTGRAGAASGACRPPAPWCRCTRRAGRAPTVDAEAPRHPARGRLAVGGGCRSTPDSPARRPRTASASTTAGGRRIAGRADGEVDHAALVGLRPPASGRRGGRRGRAAGRSPRPVRGPRRSWRGRSSGVGQPVRAGRRRTRAADWPTRRRGGPAPACRRRWRSRPAPRPHGAARPARRPGRTGTTQLGDGGQAAEPVADGAQQVLDALAGAGRDGHRPGVVDQQALGPVGVEVEPC